MERAQGFQDRWLKFAKESPELEALDDYSCAWIRRWPEGLGINDIKLEYQAGDSNNGYASNISDKFKEAMDEWIENKKAASRDVSDKIERLWKEPWGRNVRLEKVENEDHTHAQKIILSPMKFLFYRAQHNCMLGNIRLRAEFLDNEIAALENKSNEGPRFALPAIFAVHVAVISKDKKVILRQRNQSADFYPNAWEAGVGEIMHGPEYKGNYPHFINEQPDLFQFLKMAIQEELGYGKQKDLEEVTPDNFRMYGFALERDTLAPKLLAVYRSYADAADIIKATYENKPEEVAILHRSIDFTPKALAQLFREKSWGPTSKLTLMLALIDNLSNPNEDRIKVIQTLRRSFSHSNIAKLTWAFIKENWKSLFVVFTYILRFFASLKGLK